MTIIILLISVSLTLALLFLGLFFWNMKTGQYEDTYTPSIRILFGEKAGEGTSPADQKKGPDPTDT